MPKAARAAFQGQTVCFTHMSLNALGLKQRGAEAPIIAQGLAANLMPHLIPT